MSSTSPVIDQIPDIDGHEMVPTHLWESEFGPAAGRIAELSYPYLMTMKGGNDFYNPEFQGDIAEITLETVWNVRGTEAPASTDLARRIEVMDLMGVRRQLVFPSYALFALKLMNGDEHLFRNLFQTDLPIPELRELGHAGLVEYNEWAVRTAQIAPDRIRPVAYLTAEQSPAALVDEATELIRRGIRAVHLPSSAPPAGHSPAAPELDPFWELLERTDVPLLIHVGVESAFLDPTWKAAPAFKPGKVESHEIGIDPYFFSTVHFAPYNFITVMTLGGVFERFPRLRFGAIELGAGWLSAMTENLDMWAKFHAGRLAPFISRLPSEYVASNVRVTPFNTVEPVDEYFARFPELSDCYCFSTDYPHIEGGKDIKRKLVEKLEPLGSEVVEKFFTRNGELLLPEYRDVELG